MVINTTHFDYLLGTSGESFVIHEAQWVICYVRRTVGHSLVYIHETQWVINLAICEMQWVMWQ